MASRTASDLAGSNTFAKRRDVTSVGARSKDETAYYLANIGRATSIAAFVGNHRLFSYAMRAYGLEDRVYAKSLMTQILQSGLVANPMLDDPRFKAFATAFDLTGKGPEVMQAAAATTETTSLYVARTRGDLTAPAGAADAYVTTVNSRPYVGAPVQSQPRSNQINLLGGK